MIESFFLKQNEAAVPAITASTHFWRSCQLMKTRKRYKKYRIIAIETWGKYAYKGNSREPTKY